MSKYSSIDGLQMYSDRNSGCLPHILLIVWFSLSVLSTFITLWVIGIQSESDIAGEIFVWFYFGVMERIRYFNTNWMKEEKNKNYFKERDMQPFGMSAFVISLWHFNLFAISELWVFFCRFDPAIPKCIAYYYQMCKPQHILHQIPLALVSS